MEFKYNNKYEDIQYFSLLQLIYFYLILLHFGS